MRALNVSRRLTGRRDDPGIVAVEAVEWHKGSSIQVRDDGWDGWPTWCVSSAATSITCYLLQRRMSC